MKTDQQQLNDTYARVRVVFPRELLDSLAPQQRTLTENAINRVLNQEGVKALTVDRLEGIKELVTQHLWSSALTEASESLSDLPQETPDSPSVGNGRQHAGGLRDSGLPPQREPMQPTRRRNCLILNVPD
ncbi:MAG: hypothetical protein RI988_3981 [Pseudomonadota bacterium]|jgi:hypothetical protein